MIGILILTMVAPALPAKDLPLATGSLGMKQEVSSPSGGLLFRLEQDQADGALAWSVEAHGRPTIIHGALGMELEGLGVLGANGGVMQVGKRDRDTTWHPPYGTRSEIPDCFHEKTFSIGQSSPNIPIIHLQVRAYDEGIAFRYLLEGRGNWVVLSEKTSFPLPAQTAVWTSATAQGVITRRSVADVTGDIERPLTAEAAPDLFLALGEAGLVNHARMKFRRAGDSTLVAALAGACHYTNSFATPWRYVCAAESPARLLEQNYLLQNLNEASQIGDTAWLRPGKLLREVTLTTQGAMASIDYAADHGLQFILFDAGWYGPEADAASDATTVTLDPKRSSGPLDLPKVIAHARGKGIGVVLYVNRRALEHQLDELLPLYEKWGVAGIKFGFVQVGPQQWTAWLHDAIRQCAQHHLMVDVHDEYRPTGVERTLPNFMTAEGVRGDEESPKNEDVLKTLFTRCLVGAADQTGCYFADRVNQMGSHASQLAKMVCIYSPWQSVFWYDRPPGSPGAGKGHASVLQDVPELSFFERLPTVWDETRVLDGYPGTHAVIARRSGKTWFVGALNGVEARDFTIPLGFLAKHGKYKLELFSDDPTVATPTQVRIETNPVDRTSIIKRHLASRNGLAAILTPVERP